MIILNRSQLRLWSLCLVAALTFLAGVKCDGDGVQEDNVPICEIEDRRGEMSEEERMFCDEVLGGQFCGVSECEKTCGYEAMDSRLPEPSPETTLDVQVGPPCQGERETSPECTCSWITKAAAFDEAAIRATPQACAAMALSLPGCALSESQLASIHSHSANSSKSLSESLQALLTDLGVSETVPAAALPCLDCSEVGDCRSCAQRKRIMAHLLYCDASTPDVPLLRKNAVWNLCAAEKGIVTCDDFNCNDASVASCTDTDFCNQLSAVQTDCVVNEAGVVVVAEDFDCVPNTCGGQCASRYLFKGEEYQLDPSAVAGTCPLTGFYSGSSATKSGNALDSALVPLFCSMVDSKKRDKAFFSRQVEEKTNMYCQGDAERVGVVSGVSERRGAYDPSAATPVQRLRRSTGDGTAGSDEDDELAVTVSCMSGADSTEVLTSGGVCLTVLAAGVEPTADVSTLTYDTDYSFEVINEEGLTCADACNYKVSEDPSKTVLCCSGETSDGQPCNQPRAGNFGRMIQTQQCGKRCQDRKKDFLSEMCVQCSNDYDCYYNFKCTEGLCTPPVKDTSGEGRFQFDFDQTVKMQNCEGSLKETDMCHLVTSHFNPGNELNCFDESRGNKEPSDLVRGVPMSCASDENARGFADSFGRCPCGQSKVGNKCFKSELAGENQYSMFYRCDGTIKAWLEDLLDGSGEASCQTNPIKMFLENEVECEVEQSPKLAFVMGCKDICHKLSEGMDALLGFNLENEDDSDKIKAILDRCTQGDDEDEQDENGNGKAKKAKKCRAAAYATTFLAGIDASSDTSTISDLCDEAADLDECDLDLLTEIIDDEASIPSADDASTVFSLCLPYGDLKKKVKSLKKKLEAVVRDGGQLSDSCNDITSLIEVIVDADKVPGLPSVYKDLTKLLEILKADCTMDDEKYCNVAMILDMMASNVNFGVLKDLDATRYNSHISGALCEDSVCAVEPKDIVDAQCDGDTVALAVLGCLKGKYLQEKCPGSNKKLSEDLSAAIAADCSISVDLDKKQNNKKLQEAICGCSFCNDAVVGSSVDIGIIALCGDFCPSKAEANKPDVSAITDADLEDLVDADGTLTSTAGLLDLLRGGVVASTTSERLMKCIVDDPVLRGDLDVSDANVASLISATDIQVQNEPNKNAPKRFIKEMLGKLIEGESTPVNKVAKIKEYLQEADHVPFLPKNILKDFPFSEYGCTFDSSACTFSCTVDVPLLQLLGNVGKESREALATLVNGACSDYDIVLAHEASSGSAAFAFLSREVSETIVGNGLCSTYKDDDTVKEIAGSPEAGTVMEAFAECMYGDESSAVENPELFAGVQVSDAVLAEELTDCAMLLGMVASRFWKHNKRGKCAQSDKSTRDELNALVEKYYEQCVAEPSDILSVGEVVEAMCCYLPASVLEAIDDYDTLLSMGTYCSFCDFGQSQIDALKPKILDMFTGSESGSVCAAGGLSLAGDATLEDVLIWAPILPLILDEDQLSECPSDLLASILLSDVDSTEKKCRNKINPSLFAKIKNLAKRLIDSTLVDYDEDVAEAVCSMACDAIMASGSSVLKEAIGAMSADDFKSVVYDRCLACYPPEAAICDANVQELRSALCDKIGEVSQDDEETWTLASYALSAAGGCSVAQLDINGGFDLPDPDFISYVCDDEVKAKLAELSMDLGKRRRRSADDCSAMTSTSLVNLGEEICGLSEGCINTITTTVLYDMAQDDDNPLMSHECTGAEAAANERFLARFQEANVYGQLATWDANEIATIGYVALAMTADEFYALPAQSMALIDPNVFANIEFSVLEGLKSLADAGGSDHLTELTDAQLRQRTVAEVESLGLDYPYLTSANAEDERSNTRSAGTSVQATLVPLIFTLLGVGSLRALL